MKTPRKTLIVLALLASTLVASAQGKAGFVNNGSSLVVLGPFVSFADQIFVGQPVPTSGPALPSGIRLNVGLLVGSTSTTLSLVTTTPTSPWTNSPVLLNPPTGGSGVDGQWNLSNYEIQGFTGTVFMQVKVWDSGYAGYDQAYGVSYTGIDNVFSMTLGNTIIYPNITLGGGSTWAAVGNNTPIVVQVVPEPCSFGLVGLGAASIAIFRRYKSVIRR